ncbi:MAG: CopG family transcriptional regulator [Campylobacterota bacterium]|nr:CopG family transcriptional regulator [Campylobacterota bacterium]
MLSVRLDNSMEEQLNFLSKQKDISKSQIIKDSLLYYFDMLKKETKQKSSYELGSELFGKYSSGQEDLSAAYKQKLKSKITRKYDK